MTRPIKISDELYERLKEQADAEGLTLQDALVELIATPHEGLNRLEDQLRQSQEAATSRQQALQELGKQILKLRGRVDHLFELREKDVTAFNDWAATWKRIDPLEEGVDALASRVSALESVSHRHIGQTAKEET